MTVMEAPAVLLAAGLLAASPAPAVPAASPASGTARCPVPDAPAAVVRAAKPDLAPLGGERHVTGVVRVLVSLDAQGQVTDTRIERSGSQILNRAALDAAKRSTYQPALRACVPVSSTYLFSVVIDSL
jgi:TonB family protein